MAHFAGFSDLSIDEGPLGAFFGQNSVFLLITLTSLIRARLPHRFWRGLHLLSYVGWGIGVIHGLLIGTDADTAWSQMTGSRMEIR